MNVEEAAARLGVTPRRVRAMIAGGRIRAHRAGRVWVIDELAIPRQRRSLSARSWHHLAQALKNRTLENLSGQERARTANRIRQLRESEHPSRLLIEWQPPDASPDVYLDSLVAHATINNDAYLKRAFCRPAEYLRSSHDLAEVVAAERTFKGGNRRWLAETAGVTEELIRDIEAARPLSSPGQVRRVLRALDIEPTALPDMVLR